MSEYLSDVINEEIRDTPRSERAANRVMNSQWLKDHDRNVARFALLDASDAIQELHPGEKKNSVIFLRERANRL